MRSSLLIVQAVSLQSSREEDPAVSVEVLAGQGQHEVWEARGWKVDKGQGRQECRGQLYSEG